MTIEKVSKAKSKEEARQYAIDWQNWQDTKRPMFYSELVEWQNMFIKLAKKYGLVREFKENGII